MYKNVGVQYVGVQYEGVQYEGIQLFSQNHPSLKIHVYRVFNEPNKKQNLLLMFMFMSQIWMYLNFHGGSSKIDD